VEEPEAATKDLPGDESIFPQVTVEGRRPVVVMAARSAPVMTFGTTVLEAAGFDVVVEASGEAILTSLPKLKPDLILTELLLDDMDAVHFCSQVRKKGAGKAVPILVVSDLPHAPTIRKILSDDCTDFISTPIQWHVLVFRAHRWISLARKLTALQDRKVDHEEVREARDTALKATTEALQLRHYDSLTGLPNRELFVNSVGLALSQRQRLGGHPLVLFLDIENFREVNDLVGRSLGDELLKVVAKRLRNCLREDDLSAPEGKERRGAAFARFTGDQFAILVDGAEGRTLATTVAERLLQRLSEPITIGERQFRLAGRVGVADSVDLEGEGEEELVQRAETAVRYCKEQKGQRVAFFESFMNELVAQRLALTSELRTAIDQEELFLCYQLLMDCRSSLPNGVEALIRWQHPTRGVVPPGEFLAVAEESDLMVEIDRWVLRNGCRQGKRWLDRGIPLKLSLNVSMRFIEEANFAEQVLAILEESGLPAEHLQLELSERGVLPEAGRIMDQLELLASRRIQLAIDDFGTGQTSLSYLRNLPIQCVKVDRSFVSRVPEDAASAAIVSAVVAMSHHLGLKVVAEGVETEEQSDFLRRHRYDELQGFLFSRPQRAKEIEVKIGHLLEEGRAEAGGRLPAVPEEQLPDVAPAVLGEQVPGEMPAVPVDEAASEVSTPTEETDEEDRAAVIETADLPAAAATGDEASPGPPPAAPVPTESGEEVHAAPLSPAMEGESSSHLLRLARRDFLTGLYNRFSFDERLEHAAAHADRYGHKLALLLVDLDDFKYVNDTYGHPVGDALLVQMARQLQSVVRKVDTLARIGGDEFAVIYSEFQEIESVTEFARRFLSVLSEPVQVEGRELRVGGSIGVTVYPEAGSRPKDLLRQADLALYKAKNLGGGRIHFFAKEMDRDVQRSLALARDLSGALERSEFQVKYQPVVELRTGEIRDVEALLRWHHPARGVVDPGRFIPLAESTGEIRALGSWVIRSACEQVRRWQESCGQELTVSVNISPVQCRDAGFAEVVLEALEAYDLAPDRLHLELSERLLAGLPEDSEEAFRRLEAAGVGLTLDNFGSGSSALEHFKRFRFQRVKIDKSLVWTIGEGSESGAVLSGILALAHKIKVQIVAGGIERSEEATRLLAEGCELGQGFLFSKPLTGDLVLELLRRSDGHLPAEPPDEPEKKHDLRLIRGQSQGGS
jgi:diguanylate cyclase (GGDEF)-like protein